MRVPAVGADNEPGRDRASAPELGTHSVGVERVGRDCVSEALDAGSALNLRPERFPHAIVLDIPAERVEADFRRMELDRARRKERSRVIDEAERPQRRRLSLQRRPNAERVEEGDRGVEQRDGAPAPGPLAGAATEDVEAGARKA